MSTTIDERVVSMQFDNRQFEKNVSHTMTTLGKLKQSLKFDGASKGLDDINSAAGKVNMSGLGSAVETVSAKFSALQVMGVTALANITNSAVNAGKRMAKALTVDPIMTGFKEYETQINATQTILANTSHKGSTIDDVNKALEELNRYADMTIYNFTEMTRNIGTFTAAGIDLDTSVNAIQGIANLAAVSGSTSQQASTAMYQLSQALASGTIRLMDWNSVVNAGMGGEVFQNALKETSKELGTGAEAAIEAAGSFRDSLRQGWLTSEVLTQTLKKFTTSGANEYVAKYTGLTLETIEAETARIKTATNTAEAIDQVSESLANASGKSKEEIKSILEFAQNATDAATKVKTFTQLWDVMKEASQSGWAQTWKTIVGDFEEAKALLTPLADFFTGVINGISDARNKLLESALGQNFRGLGNAVSEIFERISTPIKAVGDVIDGVTRSLEEHEAVVGDVILGKWGETEERWGKLAKAGYDWMYVQNRVNEQLGNSLRRTTDYTGELTEQTKTEEELKEIQKKRIVELANLNDAQRLSLGMTLEENQAFRDLKSVADSLGVSVEFLLDNMDNIDGRWLLFNSLKNIGKGLLDVFTAVKTAWQEIFPPKSTEEKASAIFNIIGAFHKFTTALTGLVNSETGEVSETFEKIVRTFKGLFAIVDMVSTVLGGGFRIVFKVLSYVLSHFNLNILDVTAAIGDAAVKFHDWFESIFDISGALKLVVPIIEDVVDAVKNWANAIKESDAFEVANNIVDGLVNGLKSRLTDVWNAATNIATQVLESIKTFLGIHSPSTEMEEVGKFTVDGFILGIQNGSTRVWESIQGLFGKIVEWVRGLDFGAVVAGLVGIGTVKAAGTAASALDKISSPMEGVGELLENTAIMVKKVTKPVKNVIKGVAKIEKAIAFNISMEGVKTLAISLLMLAGAVALLSLCDEKKLWNAVGVIGTLSVILGVLAFAMNKIGSASASFNLKDGLNIKGLTLGLVGIGAAILLIAASVKLLGNMDPDAVKQGFIGLAGAVVAIGIVLAAFSLLNVGSGKAAENVGKLGGTLVKLSIALLLMAALVKIVSKLSEGELVKGAQFLGGFLAFLLLFNLIALIPSKNIDKLGGMMLKISIALLTMAGVVKLVSGFTNEELIAGIKFLGVFVVFVGILSAIGGLGGKAIEGVGKMMLSLSVALLLMVGVIKLIGTLSPDELVKGAAAIAVFTVIISMLVKSIMKNGSEAPKVAATILAFSIAIAILAAVAVVCSMINIEGLAKGILAVGALSLMMMGLIAATRGASNVMSTVVAIAAAIGVLVAGVAVLGMLDPVKLATGVAALTILLGMLTLLIKVAGTAQKAMGTIIAITGVVLLVGGVLYLLSGLPTDSVMGSAISLSVLLMTMTGILAILSVIGPAATAAYPAMLALAALIAGLMVVLLALGGLSKIPGFNELIADGGATLALIGQALGAFVGSIVAGFAAAVLTILPMFGLALSGFMVGVTPFITGIKMIDASVLEGAGILVATILAITAANVIAGIASLGGLGLIGLGLQLSGFITAAMPFITSAAKIKPEMVAGIKSLAETLLILTAADLLNGLKIFGGSSLESFATQLPKLGEGLSKFSSSLGEFTDEQLATVNCAAKAIKTLAQASNEIPNAGGLLGALVGENDLGTFAEQFPVLGSGLRGFLNNIGEFTDAQLSTVNCAADAIKTLAEASSEIPNAGGWLGQIVGDNDLSTFAEQFPVLATGLRGFIDNVGTLDDTTSATVTAGANAVAALAKAAKDIPNEGGWLGKIVGDNNLGVFAENFPALGVGLRGFVDNIGTFSDDQTSTVSAAVRAVNALTGLANADLANATMNIGMFGDTLVPFAEDFSGFCSNMPSVSTMTATVSVINSLLSAIQSIADANFGCLSSFGTSLRKVGKNAVDKFIEAFTDSSAKTDLKDAAKKLADKASEGIEAKKESIKTAGKNLGDGLIEGINAKKSAVYWAAYALGQEAVQGEKDGQQSNSPSKATIKAGKWIGEGLVIGIGNMSRQVYDAGSNLGRTATSTISSAVSKIASAIDTNIDAQPTIRPVLDLSDVRSGAGAIGGMFNGASVGVSANLSAISSGMAGYGQNGGNGDVVSAINKLRKDLGNISGNTYQINGVTYDDGSNIKDAVSAIVRQAKIERRV